MSEEQFEELEVNFSDTEVDGAIETFVNSPNFGFNPASVYQFNHELKSGKTMAEACRVLLFNEVCIKACEESIRKGQAFLYGDGQQDG